jgi:hypothetical protein
VRAGPASPPDDGLRSGRRAGSAVGDICGEAGWLALPTREISTRRRLLPVVAGACGAFGSAKKEESWSILRTDRRGGDAPAGGGIALFRLVSKERPSSRSSSPRRRRSPPPLLPLALPNFISFPSLAAFIHTGCASPLVVPWGGRSLLRILPRGARTPPARPLWFDGVTRRRLVKPPSELALCTTAESRFWSCSAAPDVLAGSGERSTSGSSSSQGDSAVPLVIIAIARSAAVRSPTRTFSFPEPNSPPRSL